MSKAIWWEFVNRDHCGLCGNSGWIDTRGVRTAAGYEVGVRRPCICPNGRAIKRKLRPIQELAQAAQDFLTSQEICDTPTNRSCGRCGARICRRCAKDHPRRDYNTPQELWPACVGGEMT